MPFTKVMKHCTPDVMHESVITFLDTLKKLTKAGYTCYVKIDVAAHNVLNGLPELRARVANGKNVYDIVYTYGGSCEDTYTLKTLWLDIGGNLGYYNFRAHVYFKLTPRVIDRDREAHLTTVAVLRHEHSHATDERKQQLDPIPEVITWRERADKVNHSMQGEYIQLGVSRRQNAFISERLNDAICAYSPDVAYIFDLNKYL